MQYKNMLFENVSDFVSELKKAVTNGFVTA
jgi:hypothetical protein